MTSAAETQFLPLPYSKGMLYIGSGEPYDGNVYALGGTYKTVSPPEGAIVVPDDYATIQEAIDNAPENGTVFVRSGSYRERVFVTKPLTLLGEDPENTVVSFDIDQLLVNGVIEVMSADVTISGFTITGSWIGIWAPDDYSLPPRSRIKIIGNNVIDNVLEGISIEVGENHVISGNNITENGDHGINLGSPNSVISGNNITNNQGYGIRFDGCSNSIIYQNNITRNSIGVELLNHQVTEGETSGSNNTVYRNNIVDNIQQAFVDKEYSGNDPSDNGTDVVSWDNGKEGNYWSDYSGTGSYVIDENNTDHNPLMRPVDISSTTPPNSEPPSDSTLTIAAVGVAVVIIVFAVTFFIYRTKTKETK
jgi:parallel beta-helix repeat protein